MKTKIKGSVYYFGYEEPFLLNEQEHDKEKDEEEPEPEPPPIEEPEKDTPKQS